MTQFTFIHLQEVSSTMDVIKQYENNTVLLADSQTAGRGKTGRKWESPQSNNIYISFKIKDIGENSYCYVFVLSLVILKSIKHFFPQAQLQLKWPNDVLLNEKKIAGTLIERDLTKGELITGTGLNVDFSPENTLFTATNLKQENLIIDKITLVKQVIKEMEQYTNQNINFSSVIQEWLKYGYNLGKTITVKNVDNSSKTITGIFKTIDNSGNLILQTENKLEKIFVGDVF